eukprot:444822_1
MYNHSENLKIYHPIYENINLICSPKNETHFIEIDMNNKVTQQGIFELSQAVYDGELFPCEGIHIDCTQIDNVPKGCDVEYKLNVLSFDGFEEDLYEKAKARGIQCYWMNVEQLYKFQCGSKNTCDQNNITKEVSLLISKGVLAAIVIVCIVLVLAIIALIGKLYKDKQASYDIPMENPMVISLAIGHYSSPPENREIQYDFDSLEVDIDVRTLLTLCDKDNLNYTVYPEYEDVKNIKIYWTYRELKQFLKRHANILERNLEQQKEQKKEQKKKCRNFCSCCSKDSDDVDQKQEQEQEQEQKQKKKERNSTRLNSSHESQ